MKSDEPVIEQSQPKPPGIGELFRGLGLLFKGFSSWAETIETEARDNARLARKRHDVDMRIKEAQLDAELQQLLREAGLE